MNLTLNLTFNINLNKKMNISKINFYVKTLNTTYRSEIYIRKFLHLKKKKGFFILIKKSKTKLILLNLLVNNITITHFRQF